MEKTAVAIDATDPNLKPFLARGGKLILFQRWNDPAIPALDTIDYYKSVSSEVGELQAEQSLRLYMVPGMQHCGGGPGANAFGQDEANAGKDAQYNLYLELVNWVEKDGAPSTVIATKFIDDEKMTRPLCAYRQIAEYSGMGNKNSASSFACKLTGK